MQRLTENGKLDFIIMKHTDKFSRESNTQGSSQLLVLKMSHINLAFIIFLASSGLAIFLFAIEKLHHKYMRH